MTAARLIRHSGPLPLARGLSHARGLDYTQTPRNRARGEHLGGRTLWGCCAQAFRFPPGGEPCRDPTQGWGQLLTLAQAPGEDAEAGKLAQVSTFM